MCSGMNQSRFQKLHQNSIDFIKRHSMDDCSSVCNETGKGGVEEK